ncbi:MAG: DUF4915 domain-containing protein [Planctomycetes bacterium]|nr:DUF4915 domain-containing protein [Planctomycetota bacterium]
MAESYAAHHGLAQLRVEIGITRGASPAGASPRYALLVAVSGGNAALCLAHRDHLRREKRCVGSRSASRAISPGFQRYSGQGHLCVVDLASGKLTTVASLPGTTRGLAFFGRFAFVGLSRIREAILFGGLRITECIDEVQRRCGVLVVD